MHFALGRQTLRSKADPSLQATEPGVEFTKKRTAVNDKGVQAGIAALEKKGIHPSEEKVVVFGGGYEVDLGPLLDKFKEVHVVDLCADPLALATRKYAAHPNRDVVFAGDGRLLQRCAHQSRGLGQHDDTRERGYKTARTIYSSHESPFVSPMNIHAPRRRLRRELLDVPTVRARVVRPEREGARRRVRHALRPARAPRVGASAHGRAVKPGEREFSGSRVTLWRWREAFQNDFAARLLWTTRPPAEANHAPVVRLAHAAELWVRSGDWVTLDASPTSDPDGDSLSFQWLHYQEVGHWQSAIPNGIAANIHTVDFTAPTVTAPREAHFIVRVTDKGTPPLTRYKRVIVTITP